MNNENLQEMLSNFNSAKSSTIIPSQNENEEVKNDTKPLINSTEIGITNFYDWYETFSTDLYGIAQVKAEVSNINSKDSIIFKIPKVGSDMMELISFYKPSTRPILNLPPVRLKIFKNDTFEALHIYNEQIFIKSYGVKAGLIVVYCINIDGKIIPFQKVKIKKNVTSLKVEYNETILNEIKNRLSDEVDIEAIQLLYRQAIKAKDEFTTKESTVDWFLKKQQEVVDINHLIKIDNVLIHVI